MKKLKVKFSRVRLIVTPWTVACQAPLSMGLSRQEYWSGLRFASPGESSQLRDQTWVSHIAEICNKYFNFFFSFLAALQDFWDLNFPTSDWTLTLSKWASKWDPNHWTTREFPAILCICTKFYHLGHISICSCHVSSSTGYSIFILCT